MSELLQALAFVFRRKGATELSAMDFKHCVSLDLRWFAPADAKRLLEHAVTVGLLEQAEDVVRPRFDPQAVTVPVTFRPTLQAIDEPAPANIPQPAPAPEPEPEPEPVAAPEPVAEPEPAPAQEPAAPSMGAAPLLEASEASGERLEDLVREADEFRNLRGGLISPVVATLVVARRRGVNVQDHLKGAYESVRGA